MNPFDGRDPRPPLEIRVVDDLDADRDEAPTARARRRLESLDRRRRIAGLIGAWQVTTHVEGEPVARDAAGRPVRAWWSSRRVLVLRGAMPEAEKDQLAARLRASAVVVVAPGQDALAALESRFGGA